MRDSQTQAQHHSTAKIADLPTVSEEERRVFSRVPFSAWTEIHQQGRYWHAMLMDLSFKGFLVQEPKNWHLDADEPLLATIHFDNNGSIVLKANQVHTEKGQVGFTSNAVDLESLTSLRRVIEYNLGDHEIVARELAALEPC
ncbi:MAG: PilZ domain-containing protein [Pseudomonadales bacterium]